MRSFVIIPQNCPIRKIDAYGRSCYNFGMKWKYNAANEKERKPRLRERISWASVKAFVRKCLRLIFNPRLLLCLFFAWMITNGWSYVFVALGVWLKIKWMLSVGATYIGFLWIPFTPEKLLTVMIAILLMKLFFPKDESTLGVLHEWKQKLRAKMKRFAVRRRGS